MSGRGLYPLLLALILAPAARADAPWSTPVDAGPASVFATAPDIAFGSTGRALISWRFTEAPLRATLRGRVVSRAPDGTLGPVRELALATRPAVYGGGRAYALLRSGLEARQSLVATYGSTGGAFSGQTRLARRVRLTGDAPALAAGPQGEGAAAWIESKGGEHQLRVSLRKPAGKFRAAQTVARGRFSTPALAFTPSGMLAIVYQRTRRVGGSPKREVVVILKAPGKAIPRKVRVLGPSWGFAQISIAGGAADRVAVAWGTQDAGEAASRPYAVYAAVSTAPGVFKTTTLDPGNGIERPTSFPHAAIDPDGRAMVAWSNIDRTGDQFAYPLNVAGADDSGTFGPFDQIARNGAVGGLTFARNGTAVLTWSVSPIADPAQRSVMASLRIPETDGFGAPEVIASGNALEPPAVALDPVSGRPVAVWTSQSSTSGPVRILLATRG